MKSSFRFVLSSIITTALIVAMIFVPAGSISYWQGWLFLATFIIGSSLNGVYLAKHDPALLQRRMKAGPTHEKRPVQRLIMLLTTGAFLLLILVSALDYRFGWSNLPAAVCIIGDLVVAYSFYLFVEIYRANTFASATIEIAEGQKVISSGPYGIVRHPMYSVGLILCFGIPLALGSLWGELVFFAVLPLLIWRIKDEESMLSKSLEGYPDYCQKVRYRLVPSVY